MKSISYLLALLFILLPLQAQSAGRQDITQYMLVTTGEYGVSFRTPQKIAQLLKSIGFTATTYKAPADADDMDEYVKLKATRKGAPSGTTTVVMNNGEDPTITIKFANAAERDNFVHTLTGTGWKKQGRIYSHPANNMSKVYAKINGLTATLIHPFEMLPSGF